MGGGGGGVSRTLRIKQTQNCTPFPPQAMTHQSKLTHISEHYIQYRNLQSTD